MPYLPTGPDNTWEQASPQDFAAHYLGGGANIQGVTQNPDGTFTVQLAPGSTASLAGGHGEFANGGTVTMDQYGNPVGGPQGQSAFNPWPKDSGNRAFEQGLLGMGLAGLGGAYAGAGGSAASDFMSPDAALSMGAIPSETLAGGVGAGQSAAAAAESARMMSALNEGAAPLSGTQVAANGTTPGLLGASDAAATGAGVDESALLQGARNSQLDSLVNSVGTGAAAGGLASWALPAAIGASALGGLANAANKPSLPAAPDYTAAAKAQATSGLSNQSTPLGNQTYTPDPNSPSGYSSTITLSPNQQALLTQQEQNQLGTGQVAQGLVSKIGANAQAGIGPLDPAVAQKASDTAYALSTARLDPQWTTAGQQQDTQLRNQGLTPGTTAYDNAMRDFNFAKTDAYSQARNQAYSQGLTAQGQQFGQAVTSYGLPLSTYSTLATGAQPSFPTFGSTPQAPYLGAATSQGQYGQGLYNANVGSQNALTQGLFGLGTAGLGAYGLTNRSGGYSTGGTGQNGLYF